MKPEVLFADRKPRSWVVLDIESAVIDTVGHRRFLAMERFVPRDDQPPRRGYQRRDDPLLTPRWPFQTIVAASVMLLIEHENGNIDVGQFTTLSAPDLSERQIVEGVLAVLANAPSGTELASWAGMVHDVPMLALAAQRHGLTLPSGWRWLGFGGNDPVRHLDLARTTTGGFKMKPVHLAEVLASLDIPAKITAPAFSVARLIYEQQWDTVQEAVENDVISTALLLAHWRQLHDGRASLDVVKDRILRRVEELRDGRGYVPALREYRARLQAARKAAATASMAALAPWLEQDAA